MTNEKVDQKSVYKVNLVAEKAKELYEEIHRKVTIDELLQETALSEKAIKEAIKLSGFNIETIDLGE